VKGYPERLEYSGAGARNFAMVLTVSFTEALVCVLS
jgi:hypothetical protein